MYTSVFANFTLSDIWEQGKSRPNWDSMQVSRALLTNIRLSWKLLEVANIGNHINTPNPGGKKLYNPKDTYAIVIGGIV